MAEWNRFDICEAYCCLEGDYSKGGWLQERPSNQRRMESIGVQLHRMQFRPAMGFSGFNDLTENGQEIYLTNVLKWRLPLDEEQRCRILDFFVHDWLRENYPHVFTD